MNIKTDVIGIVGGMGSYATLNIFKRLLDAFDAKKEWDRPRIIIDNYSTLPSRSRALLFNEKYDEVSKGLVTSVNNLMYSGANIIILSSNTGHLFLEDIYKEIPASKSCIVNFIELLGNDLTKSGVKEVLLLGTTATLEHNLYKDFLSDIKVSIPSKDKIESINYFIEIVKQNKISPEDIIKFKELLLQFNEKNIVLGCTELPVLYEMIEGSLDKKIFDPINSFINYIK